MLNTRSTVKVAISCHLVRSQNENVNNTLAGQPTVYNGVTILTPNKLSVVTEENYSVSLRPFNQFPSKSFSSPITSIYNNNLDRIEISTSPIFSLREVKKKKKVDRSMEITRQREVSLIREISFPFRLIETAFSRRFLTLAGLAVRNTYDRATYRCAKATAL